MSLSGNWTLHYSWGGSSNYTPNPITFRPDGTFGGALPGKWRQRDGTVMLAFDSGPAKYGGTVDGSVGSGAMSTFAGLSGCWYLTRQGTSGIAAEKPAKATKAARPRGAAHDAAGNAL
jgi:hypothetical protein